MLQLRVTALPEFQADPLMRSTWCLPDLAAAAAGLGGGRSWLDPRPARQRQLCKHCSGLAGAELWLTLPKGGLPVGGHSGPVRLELGGAL